MGWSFPWASSLGGDFNLDFNAWYTEEQQRSGNIEYNYRKSGVSSRSQEIEALEAAPEAAVLIMALYTLARSWRGLLDGTRGVTLDNTMLLWHYTVAQGFLALGLVHLIPWILR